MSYSDQTMDDELAARAEVVARQQGTANTRRTYRTAYRSLAAFLGAGAAASAVTPESVAAWRSSLEKSGKAPGTIAVYVSAVRLLAGSIGADPRLRNIRTQRVATREQQFLEEHQLRRLFLLPDRQTLIGTRDLAILMLAGRTGLRRTELVRLDLRSTSKTNLILATREHRNVVPDATAFAIRLNDTAGRTRAVPLGSDVFAALDAWRQIRPASDTEALFTSLPVVKGRQPGPLDGRDIGRIVEKHTRAAGFSPELQGAHVLRHSFAVALARNGASMTTIRELLGQDDLVLAQITTSPNERN